MTKTISSAILALFDVGQGRLHADRLVLSGHGDGKNLVDDHGTWLNHESLRDVARAFPQGAGKIEDIAFSSCFSGTNSKEWDETRKVFPNLKSLLGYREFSPNAETRSPADLRAWAQKTDGDDPSRMDPSGRAQAAWNKVDGDENVPHLSVKDCEHIADEAQHQIDKFEPRGPGSAVGNGEARKAYIELSQARNSQGLPPELIRRLDEERFRLFPLTHPPG